MARREDTVSIAILLAALPVMTLLLLGVTRLEMLLRARKLLTQARAAKAQV